MENGRPKLKADRDYDCAKQNRNEHVGDPG
jgi:hypothetical protein